MNQYLGMYQKIGAEKFTEMVCQMAPYFSTVNPSITMLEPGFVSVEIPFRKEVTNHLGTMHAIALCNAAELAGGMMTDVSIPEGARWIPKGMQVQYLAKAKTDVVAVADGRNIDWTQPGDIQVPVSIKDTEGTEVFTANIMMNVKHD
ncbi:DUF4442 domain-containing protein [Acinetobacter sp. 194]|uniref:hotdog fold domain-containing protein n=1 Tax=Acinetobacter shaoyimingii TaxID=2715164 RepID=UPI00140840EF|nr:hotdog fold domain-containing protein [Acinetobacter shaoyimingii]NHB57497.1 DUF4442 domain-containing protein [Acinetobacter shaoyimingii]